MFHDENVINTLMKSLGHDANAISLSTFEAILFTSLSIKIMRRALIIFFVIAQTGSSKGAIAF